MSVEHKPQVTVLASRYVAGDAPDGAACGPLPGALLHPFRCDAHMQAGTAADGRRITRASLDAGPVVMAAFVVDLDPPQHEPDAAWSAAAAAKLEALIAARGGFAYSTAAGWRYVAQLAEPVELRGAEGWAEWRGRYLAALDALEAAWGLEGDRACSTPGHLFRLGFVVRDGVKQRPQTIGVPERLGAFQLPPAPSAPSAAPSAPHAGDAIDARPLHEGRSDAACSDGAEPAGELYELCAAAGLIVGPCPRGGLTIRCPNDAKHSRGTAGDGSTVLYPATSAAGMGWIECKHTACAKLTADDWRRLLKAPSRSRRVVRIVSAREIRDGDAIRLEIAPLDGAEPIYPPPPPGWGPAPPGHATLTIPVARSWGTAAARKRYDSLWSAAGIEPPRDADLEGDLGGAIDELSGRTLELELVGADVRRIHRAKEAAA